MSSIIVTGSAGLIGSESVHFFARLGFNVIGIDNKMRSFFFGQSATMWNQNLNHPMMGLPKIHMQILLLMPTVL